MAPDDKPHAGWTRDANGDEWRTARTPGEPLSSERAALYLERAFEEIEHLRRRLDDAQPLIDYARRKVREEENAAWAWQVIKTHAKWVIPLATLVSAAFTYLATHSFTIGSK